MKIIEDSKRYAFVEKYRKQIVSSYNKLPQKRELSREQEREIQAYWKKYYGYEIPLDWHRYFYARTGVYSPKYIPTGVYRGEIIYRLNQVKFGISYSDKNMLDILVPNIRQSHIYLKNRNGHFYYENEPVSKQEAAEKCANLGVVLIKPSLASHGKGVQILNIENGVVAKTGQSVLDLLTEYQQDFLIQDLVRQHEGMSALNPDSVNTLRIVTYRKDMDVHIMYAIARIGRKGKVIDNESAGGISVKVHDDGTLDKYAYGAPEEGLIERTDSGVKLEGYQLPSYDKVKDFVKRVHLYMPFQSIIGWDVCIDESGEPLLLEWNTNPELSQTAVGPAFGDYTEEILQEAMKHRNTLVYDGVSLRTVIKYVIFHVIGQQK